MTKLYKLTDENGRTYGGCQWGPGVTNTAPGNGPLCSPAWIHAYTDPLLAVMLNSIHGNFAAPRLWECEGEIGANDRGLKVGCTTLTTLREIPVPAVTTEQRVKFAILCALQVYNAPAFVDWAQAWLDGTDQSMSTARAAWVARAAAWAAWAAWAAGSTAWAARAAWAAGSAAWAASKFAILCALQAAAEAAEVTVRGCDAAVLEAAAEEEAAKAAAAMAAEAAAEAAAARAEEAARAAGASILNLAAIAAKATDQA